MGTRPLPSHEPIGIIVKRLMKNLLASGAVMAVSLLGVATPSAVADTSTLHIGCFVDSWRLDDLQDTYCEAQDPALGYRVHFEVLGRSAGAYSYSWGTSRYRATTTIVGGCTSSFHYCTLDVRNSRGSYWEVTWSPVVTELATGASKTVTGVAAGQDVCQQWYWDNGAPYFC